MNHDECLLEIRKYDDTTSLLALFQGVKSGSVGATWDSGKAFEYLILRAFEIEGAEVVWPYSISDEGDTIEQIDGVVYCDGLPPSLVEAKDHKSAVDFEPVAKLRNQLLRRPAATVGMCFSKGGFTSPAKTLAKYTPPQTILLWSGEELEWVLSNAAATLVGGHPMTFGYRKKYRYAVEYGLPDFALETIAL